MSAAAAIVVRVWIMSLWYLNYVICRLHMLKKSNESLPISFAFVNCQNDTVEGHSRLSPVFGDSKACFVESGKYFTIYELIFF